MHLLIPTAALAAMVAQQASREAPTAKPADEFQPPAEWKSLGPHLWFDPTTKPKRLIIEAQVVLREGVLEHLLCLRGTKEHEAIVATAAAPKQIHAGLLLTGAEVGHPVRFRPKFEPPSGSPIAIAVQWERDGQTVEADARSWIKNDKTGKELDIDWVFAGSTIYEDPITKNKVYAAEEGDLITVANFGSSILDVPVASSADNANLFYIANTEKIPPLNTKVRLILSPRPPKETKESKEPKAP